MPDSHSAAPSELSELEGGVLGIVHESPGCTAHSVRERFRRSRSSHWSGSAGAIYPLMKKLLEAGLLSAEETPRGSRVRRTYSITAAGTRELKRWLGPPLPEWVASVTFDPLRTRVPFLDALPKARQLAFLEEAEALLEAELQELRRERKAVEDEPEMFWELVSAEGCVASAQARLRWIRGTIDKLREL